MEKFVSVKKLRSLVSSYLQFSGTAESFFSISDLIAAFEDWKKLIGDKKVVITYQQRISVTKCKNFQVQWSATEILKALENKKNEWSVKYAVQIKKAQSVAKAQATRAANLTPERKKEIAVRAEFRKQVRKLSFAGFSAKNLLNLEDYAARWKMAGMDVQTMTPQKMLSLAISKAMNQLEKVERQIDWVTDLIFENKALLTQAMLKNAVFTINDKAKLWKLFFDLTESAAEEWNVSTKDLKTILLENAFYSGLKKIEKVGHVKFLERLN